VVLTESGVELWTFTRMCRIPQTDAISLFTSTLQLYGGKLKADVVINTMYLYSYRCMVDRLCV